MIKKSSHDRGKQGERFAREFLEKKGWRVIEENYRYRRNEVDLIAQYNNLLVFVEVKLRRNAAFGHPETFVNEAQAQRIVAAAEHYLLETDWRGNIRFDIIAITLQPQLSIDHFEDAFA